MKLDAGDPNAKILKPPTEEERKEILKKREETETFTMQIPRDLNQQFTVNCALARTTKTKVLMAAIESFNEKYPEIERAQAERSEGYLND